MGLEFSEVYSTFKKPFGKYDSNYIKKSMKKFTITEKEFAHKIQNDIKIYNRERYSTKYDNNYKNTIQKLVKNHPEIKFTVLTTPVSNDHFQALISQGLYASYEKWLSESVEVFGEIHHFMYKSELSNNAYTYFQDSNHGYNFTYDCLTYEILQKVSSCPKTNIILNSKNIDIVLKEQLYPLNHEL